MRADPSPFASADPCTLLKRLVVGTEAIQAALDRGDAVLALAQIRDRELAVRSLCQQLSSGTALAELGALRPLWEELVEHDRRIEQRLERLRSETSDALRTVGRDRRALGQFRAPPAGASVLSDLG